MKSTLLLPAIVGVLVINTAAVSVPGNGIITAALPFNSQPFQLTKRQGLIGHECRPGNSSPLCPCMANDPRPNCNSGGIVQHGEPPSNAVNVADDSNVNTSESKPFLGLIGHECRLGTTSPLCPCMPNDPRPKCCSGDITQGGEAVSVAIDTAIEEITNESKQLPGLVGHECLLGTTSPLCPCMPSDSRPKCRLEGAKVKRNEQGNVKAKVTEKEEKEKIQKPQCLVNHKCVLGTQNPACPCTYGDTRPKCRFGEQQVPENGETKGENSKEEKGIVKGLEKQGNKEKRQGFGLIGHECRLGNEGCNNAFAKQSHTDINASSDAATLDSSAIFQLYFMVVAIVAASG